MKTRGITILNPDRGDPAPDISSTLTSTTHGQSPTGDVFIQQEFI